MPCLTVLQHTSESQPKAQHAAVVQSLALMTATQLGVQVPSASYALASVGGGPLAGPATHDSMHEASGEVRQLLQLGVKVQP